MADTPQPAQLHYYVRIPVPMSGGKYRYHRPVRLSSEGMSGSGSESLVVPVVGDLVFLWDSHDSPVAEFGRGTFKVLGRQIHWSGLGSANWPYDQRHSNVGPWVDLVVEKVEEGLIVDEAPVGAWEYDELE